jgi:hypothetical protein
LLAHEDTVWTTFHVTEKTDPDEIVMEIADVEPNPLLTKDDYGRAGWRAIKSEPLIEELLCL